MDFKSINIAPSNTHDEHYTDGIRAMYKYLYEVIFMKMRELFPEENGWKASNTVNASRYYEHSSGMIFEVHNKKYFINIHINLYKICSFYAYDINYVENVPLNNAFQQLSINIKIEKNCNETIMPIFNVYTPFQEVMTDEFSDCYLINCHVYNSHLVCILNELHKLYNVATAAMADDFCASSDNYREIYKWYGYGDQFIIDETYTNKLMKNVVAFIDAKEIEKTLRTIRDTICV